MSGAIRRKLAFRPLGGEKLSVAHCADDCGWWSESQSRRGPSLVGYEVAPAARPVSVKSSTRDDEVCWKLELFEACHPRAVCRPGGARMCRRWFALS